MHLTVLVLLLAAARLAPAAVPVTNAFAACEGSPRDVVPLDCGAGHAEVLGVARTLCPDGTAACQTGDLYSYRVEVDVHWDAATRDACNVSIPWTVVPYGATDVVCGTASRCTTDACVALAAPQTVTFAVAPPTFVRGLTPVYRAPTEYVALMRRMSGVGSVDDYDINDDDTLDAHANQCLSNCSDGNCRYRAGCLELACAPNCRALNVDMRAAYRASAAACWNAGDQYVRDEAVEPGEFSPDSASPADDSASCCKRCGLNGCAGASAYTCNAQPLRFPFPALAPQALLAALPNVGASATIVNASNVLVPATADLMNGTTTLLLPAGSVAVSGVDPPAYYATLVAGGDVPAPRRRGVYTTLPYGSPADSSDQINSLVCAYCGEGGGWDDVCTTPGDPGTFAWKFWVLGVTPWQTYYKIAQAGAPRLVARVSVGGAAADYPAYDPAAAQEVDPAPGVVTQLQSLTPGSLPDPMQDPVPAGVESFGGVMIGDAAPGAAARRYAGTGLVNPYTGVANPDTGAPDCGGCMLDQQPSPAEPDSRTLFYFVTQAVADLFLPCSATAVASMAASVGVNGFTDSALLDDDCDSTCIQTGPSADGYWGALPPHSELEDSGVPAWAQVCNLGVEPPCCATQICAADGGKAQSAICTGQAPAQGRPSVSSLTIGLYMQQYRANVLAKLTAQANNTWAYSLRAYAPQDFDRWRPNYWFGWALDGAPHLFYQTGPDVAATPGRAALYSTVLRVTAVVGDSVAQPLTPAPQVNLEAVDYCPCTFGGHGELRVSGGPYSPAGELVAFTAAITYPDAVVTCSVNDGQPFSVTLGDPVAVPFFCARAANESADATGVIVFTNAATGVALAPYALPCCGTYKCRGASSCLMLNGVESKVSSGVFDLLNTTCLVAPDCFRYGYSAGALPAPTPIAGSAKKASHVVPPLAYYTTASDEDRIIMIVVWSVALGLPVLLLIALVGSYLSMR